MKRGLILYVTGGKKAVPIQGEDDLLATARSLGVSAISIATSGDDVGRGWWHLMNRGIQLPLLMTVSYDPALDRFESRGTPVRLCGQDCWTGEQSTSVHWV